MVSERGLDVLRAIVRDYVETREPVGSKAIVDRYSFDVSAATIRNDMALLEDEELIAAPHTSSGRVPTDKGYRLFVNHLAQVRPLSSAQRAAIESFLREPADIDDLMVRTVRVLTQLTGQVALAQYPSIAKAVLTHIELVMLTADRVLVVLVTDAGGVSQRIAQLSFALDPAEVSSLKAAFAREVVGKSVQEASNVLIDFATGVPGSHTSEAAKQISQVIHDELESFRQERLVMAGTATLARREHDFRGSIHPLLEAMEEQVTLLRLMGEMVADDQGLATSIGTENDAFGLPEASIVAGTYASSVGPARVAVMGPTRMDYPSNLAAARAVARYLTRMLDEDDSR